MNNGEAESGNDNNDKVPGDPVGRSHGPKGPRLVVDMKDPKDPWDQLTCLHEFSNQMPYFSAKDNKE